MFRHVQSMINVIEYIYLSIYQKYISKKVKYRVWNQYLFICNTQALRYLLFCNEGVFSAHALTLGGTKLIYTLEGKRCKCHLEIFFL